MAYSLTLSHVGIYVKDLDRMVDFYSGFMGFAVSDRGVTRGGVELCFLTRDPREHHQFVLATGRPEPLRFNIVNQLSFRVDSLATLRELHRGLAEEQVSAIEPTCHGNAVSVYFRDPEGNRVELLTGTPWYIQQPIHLPIDLSLPDDAFWADVEAKAAKIPGFKSLVVWEAEIRQRIAEATTKRRRAAATPVH
jgi:catechol 2,3-dioxygenase-like lactoylglutathione lyase family enzyme